MKELQELIKRVEVEINKTPSGELRNLLCDANIMLQQQALNIPDVSSTSCACKVKGSFDTETIHRCRKCDKEMN